ncbi:general stress protein [Filibacter tadaridae]|uniref:Heat induced stress protein YflT n=1 Tax=Filibacter tadaridae TaxID=2483811 RepID=A0A3P5WC75_9BACL|nr:general stress protein [Filibacter tadaridae]VDC21083.1 Heat induced stress protein YflT [Filibacter tadaridae]
MADKKYVGTFHSIDTALNKITELIAKGHSEEEIYAVSNGEDNILMMRGETDIHLLGLEEGKWLDHSNTLFFGEEIVVNILMRLGFTEEQAKNYFTEVEFGGVAFFVDAKKTNRDDAEMKNQDEENEMDSQGEQSPSGELLANQDDQSRSLDNEETVPRIDTGNL